MIIGRRGLIGTAAALAVAPAAAATTFAAPADKLRALMLMRGALDDRLVIYWLRGRYFGLVDGEVKPLFGVVNACFSRYRAHPDGGFIGARGEVSHYTDFDTGEVVGSVRNPYDGRIMEPPPRGYPPSPVRIEADSSISIKEMPGMEFANAIHDIEVTGDDARMFERNASKVPLPGGKASLYNEMVTYRARVADLRKPGANRVPCDINFTNTVSWRSWMGMADHPGHMLAVGSGAFVARVADLPAAWLKATAATQPELLGNPQAFLDPVWKTIA
ncbi:DUF1838 family protein [Glacieibacterium frigidum]